jgi:hypothetical protein
MPEWILYLLKFNLSLGLVWLFYQVLLRKLTFYTWNRVYLMVYSSVCFLIPFINIDPWLNSSGMAAMQIVHSIPTVSHLMSTPVVSAANEGQRFGYPFLLGMVLLAGSLVMGVRLLIMYISILRISSRAKLIVDEAVQIFETSQDVVPFSFGNKIFIQPSSLPGRELETIIRHEFIHVNQKHSLDILFTEFLCIIAWYSPFAWLIRHAVRQNLEFIADNMILNNGIDRKGYQYLLLKVTGHAPISIGNQFNLSSLKNRMVMMNKSKSKKKQLLKFVFSLPLVVILLMAFRNAGESMIPNLLRKNITLAVGDTLPPPPPPQVKPGQAPAQPKVAALPPAPPKPGAQPRQFTVSVDKDNRLTVQPKNGKKEYYDLTKPDQKRAFEKKYGFINPGNPPKVAVDEKLELNEVVVDAPENAEVPTAVAVTPAIAASPVTKIDVKPVKAGTSVASVQPAPAEGEDIEIDGEVLLNLTYRSTQTDINKQVEKLKAKGYTIVISNTVWKEGKLVLIEGTLGGKKKKSQFKAADFKELIFSESNDKNSESGIQFYVIRGMLNVN